MVIGSFYKFTFDRTKFCSKPTMFFTVFFLLFSFIFRCGCVEFGGATFFLSDEGFVPVVAEVSFVFVLQRYTVLTLLFLLIFCRKASSSIGKFFNHFFFACLLHKYLWTLYAQRRGIKQQDVYLNEKYYLKCFLLFLFFNQLFFIGNQLNSLWFCYLINQRKCSLPKLNNISEMIWQNRLSNKTNTFSLLVTTQMYLFRHKNRWNRF